MVNMQQQYLHSEEQHQQSIDYLYLSIVGCNYLLSLIVVTYIKLATNISQQYFAFF